MPSSRGAIWHWHQHGDQLGATLAGDGECSSRSDGHKPRSISGAHRTWLLAPIKGQDFTLRGLVSALAERGLEVDYRTVWRFAHDEKLSFKEKRGGWRARSS